MRSYLEAKGVRPTHLTKELGADGEILTFDSIHEPRLVSSFSAPSPRFAPLRGQHSFLRNNLFSVPFSVGSDWHNISGSSTPSTQHKTFVTKRAYHPRFVLTEVFR